MKPEIRNFALTEIRTENRGADGVTMRGYAAVFEQLSENLGGFREKIAPGAFDETIKRGDDVVALFNHDENYILGRTGAGTLRLNTDKRGLAIEIDAPNTPTIADLVLGPMERGELDKMSFAFRTINDTWETVDGEEIRTLDEVDLRDVSPVTRPAYIQTDIALRSLAAHQGQPAAPDFDLADAVRKLKEGGALSDDELKELTDIAGLLESRSGKCQGAGSHTAELDALRTKIDLLELEG